jgi:hypothetical protein
LKAIPCSCRVYTYGLSFFIFHSFARTEYNLPPPLHFACTRTNPLLHFTTTSWPRVHPLYVVRVTDLQLIAIPSRNFYRPKLKPQSSGASRSPHHRTARLLHCWRIKWLHMRWLRKMAVFPPPSVFLRGHSAATRSTAYHQH